MPPIKLTDEQLQPIIDAFVTYGEAQGARYMGLARGTFRSRLAAARARGLVGTQLPPTAPDATPPLAAVLVVPSVAPRGKEKIGRSFNDFVEAHDDDFIVPSKIRKTLAKLGTGWLYEEEFRKLTEIPTAAFARYRDQFMDHIVIIKGSHPKRVWVGSTDQAAEFRKRVTS